MRCLYSGFTAMSLLLLCGCAHSPGADPGRAAAPKPEPYVRIASSDSNHIALQIAVREFLPAHRGQPAVWLTGVSHIGERGYYAALQAHLRDQTLVLFEGIGAAENEDFTNNATAPEPGRTASETVSRNTQSPASLQTAMASALGLVFQLDAIDYRQPNFRNSDLSISQLRQLMTREEAASGQPGASESFENLIGLMEGNSWFDWLIQAALRLLGSNPKFQALGRLTLIDLLGEIQGDPARLEGLPPEIKQLLEVLLQRRNEKVITDLRAALPRVGRHGSIAIFFGTGHMPDLEQRLRGQLKYRPGQELWFTAFGVDLSKSNVTAAERTFIDNFVKWQLAEASHQGSK